MTTEELKLIQQVGQRWLTDEKFSELFEEGQKILDTRKEGEEITMFFMLHGHNVSTDKWCVMPVMFADWPPPEEINGKPFGKRGTLMAVGVTFAEKFPNYMLVDIVHVSEAWVVELPKDAPKEDYNLQPSKSPSRIEVGLVHALSVDRRVSYRSSKLIRKDGKFAGWELMHEQLHDPENPLLPDEQSADNLTNYIYAGYMKAKHYNEKGDPDA